jgi:hypothetical protein
MAHRTAEIRNAVRDEVERTDAKVVFGFTGSSHQVAEVEWNGGSRKVFFAASPSDRNSYKNAVKYTRKALVELGAPIVR